VQMLRGKELMEKGLLITSPGQPSSHVFVYTHAGR
jgi:hypothetical protein